MNQWNFDPLELCILAPSLTPGEREAYVVCHGRVIGPENTVHPSPRDVPLTVDADELDRLLAVASFLTHPPPELTILPLRGCEGRGPRTLGCASVLLARAVG